MAFSTSPSEKRGFRIAPIFNGLQPSKMSVALYRLAGSRKTAFFNSLLVSISAAGAIRPHPGKHVYRPLGRANEHAQRAIIGQQCTGTFLCGVDDACGYSKFRCD
jgi:hypothetical protein